MAARWAVFRPPSRILAIFGSGHLRRESTPNFDPRSMKFGQIVRVTKKIILIDNRGSPKRNYGETALFAFCRKSKNGPKIRFLLNNHPKTAKRLTFIWEKGTFLFSQLCPVVAGTWLGVESECLFSAPKIWILARKSVFCNGTPIFVNGTFLGMDIGYL